MDGFPDMSAAKAAAGERASQKERGAPPFVPYAIIDPTLLLGRPIPPRQWIVEDWLPIGHVTALYGDGGTGKTLLAQQLMTSCATGALWCGRDVFRCNALGILCEDSEDELHRRQADINRALGLDFNDLGGMRWASGIGLDNILMKFDAGAVGEITKRLEHIEQEAKAFGAQLVVIDTAADTFGGNENDRSQVRQFIGRALNGLAMAIGGAVLLNAHPSRSGLSATGDLDGGSTGWSNSVRSRWSLARPKKEDDGPEPDPNERILTRRKSNYSAIGEDIKLRWVDGVLSVETDGRASRGAGSRQAAEMVFLTLLDRLDGADRRLSDSKNAGNYAPKLLAKQPGAEGYGARDFAVAMERLFADGKLVLVDYGRPGDARQRIARAPEKQAAEAAVDA